MIEEKLSFKTKFGFSGGEYGSAVIFMVANFWLLLFMTDVVGIPAAAAGVVFMIGRAFDAINDPIMGYISDNTRSKWGRRRPYMFVGGIFLLATMVLLFTNPVWISSVSGKIVWLTVVYCFASVANTLNAVPYNSLTAEITRGYKERVTLNAYRMIATWVSLVLAMSVFFPLVQRFTAYRTTASGEAVADQSPGFMVAALVMGVIMAAGVMLTVFTVKEKYNPEHEPKKERINVFRSYLLAFTNVPYVLILLTWVIGNLGYAMTSASMLYYFTYVVGAPGRVVAATLVFVAVAFATIPLWNFFVRTVGKRSGIMVSGSVTAAALFGMYLFGHTSGVLFTFVMFGFMGLGMGGLNMTCWATIPDTVEWDYLQTGKRREGVYYALWTFGQKLATALAALIVGFILNMGGYVANTTQNAGAVAAIRFSYGLLSAVIVVISVLIITFYPLTEKKYTELTDRIREMERTKLVGVATD